jgi:hypothetical protein
LDNVHLAAAQKSAIIQIMGKLIDIVGSKQFYSAPTELDWHIQVGPKAQPGIGPKAQPGMPAS